MAMEFAFWAILGLVCQTQSQLLSAPKIGIPAPLPLRKPAPILPSPILSTPVQPPIPKPCCLTPVVLPPALISTTVVDNSVANSLANTIQLLVVSELIQNSLNKPILAAPILTNVGPLCDAIGTIGTIDVLTPVVDVTPVNYSPVVDVTSSAVSEVASVGIGGTNIYAEAEASTSVISAPGVASPIGYAPNVYGPIQEVVAPIAPVSAPVSTNVYNSVTEVVNTAPFITEFVSPIPPIPSVDVYTSVSEVVNPVVSPPAFNPYYDIATYSPGYFTEIVNPLPLQYLGGCPEFNPLLGGITFPAELTLPQAIPAQLTCNLAYGPNFEPVINVESITPLFY